MKDFSYEEVEAATGGFALENLVGKGSHGGVYKARLRGGEVVAVKKPSHAFGDGKVANEITVLSFTRGDGIVNLVGVAAARAKGASRMLVMEYMPGGSLHDLLHATARPPPWRRRAEIALDMARAVLALHGGVPRVIHRDIKSANVLLGRDGRARLADFSLAVSTCSSSAAAAVDAGDTMGPAPAGTIGYLDPCYTEPSRLGPESDVFSFGVVLLELVSGRKVMDVNSSPSSIVSWAVPLIKSGRSCQVFDGRIAAPTGAAERALGRVLGVAARCVSETVAGRPAMAEVVGELQASLGGAGWRHGWSSHRVAVRFYRCVVSWVRASKVECTEHDHPEAGALGDHPLHTSGTDGTKIQPDQSKKINANNGDDEKFKARETAVIRLQVSNPIHLNCSNRNLTVDH